MVKGAPVGVFDSGIGGLTVLEDICDVSARLVVNRVAMKTKRERIRQIIDGLGALLAVKQEGQA